MRWGAAIGFLVGLALAAWLLASYGLGTILGLLVRAGWGLVAIVLFHVVQILFSALAWRSVAGPMRPQPGIAEFMALRWIREGVNSLLPVAQIGGGVISARLMCRDGVPLVPAVAGSVGDLTMEMLTQILFTLIGLGLLVLLVGESGIIGYLLAGVAVSVTVAGSIVAAGWLGMGGPLERGLMRLSRWFGGSARDVHGLDDAIRALYRTPSRLARACFHNSLSWLLGGVEVCLALHLLGASIGFGEAMVIETLGQAVRAAGFAVPGALGVAEGGYVAIGHLFGLAPELAIALGLMKRLREVGLGIPALIAWQVRERRPARVAAPLLPGAGGDDGVTVPVIP